MSLLQVQLQEVRRGERLPADGAGVSVHCVVVSLGLVQLTEGLPAARHSTAELPVVDVQELLDVLESEEGRPGHAGNFVSLGQTPGAGALYRHPHLGHVSPNIEL